MRSNIHKSRLYGLLSVVLLVSALTACFADSSDDVAAAQAGPDTTASVSEDNPAAPTVQGEDRTGALDAAGTGSSTDDRKPSAPPEPPMPEIAVIPSGTQLTVILIDSISTDRNKPGDAFLASLASPVLVEDTVVLEKGTRVRGRIVEAADSGRIRGRASIEMTLTDILTDDGTITIQTQPFAEEAESDTARDAKIGAAGAAVGALIGGLTGGKKGAIAGAAAGAAGTVVATKGKELSYPSESRMTFTLSANVRVVPTRF